MELKNKLKKLRIDRNMTQEMVANKLCVSSQTVSKWERGLLSPDIALLPKIALLFQCSIDFLFDMELAWSVDHRREFEAKIHKLYQKKDWKGVYQAWIREIELNPDNYGNYPEVMLHVYRKKLYDKDCVEKMISLAEHAEKYCEDDDKRNEIYRIMLQLCSESEDTVIKKKGKYYYKKLPSLRHSREVYAKFVMEGEEYRAQILKNIIYEIDLAECCVRQLITPDMQLEEKLFYYQKAAALYEVILDSKYAGFYDPPLLYNYYEIAVIYIKIGQTKVAADYVGRILKVLEKHMADSKEENKSKLLYSSIFHNAVPTEQTCKKLLQKMLKTPELEPFKSEISNVQKIYDKYVLHIRSISDENQYY